MQSPTQEMLGLHLKADVRGSPDPAGRLPNYMLLGARHESEGQVLPNYRLAALDPGLPASVCPAEK